MRDEIDASSLLWCVAHTRPRCEKKLLRHCERESLIAHLPCYRRTRKYTSKTVVFEKPLFPGYVFLQVAAGQRGSIERSDCVARVLTVPEQSEFSRQIEEIYLALNSGLEIQLAPEIGPGARVKIKRGALEGLEGWVERRYGMSIVLLRLDFIGKAAAVTVEADSLEIIG